MKKQTYERMTSVLRKNERAAKLLGTLNKVLTYVIFAAYPSMLVYLFIAKREMLLRAVIVPAVSFVLLSLFRRAVNCRRPYEVFGIPPVIPKKTKGKSFPSRHVFSVALIGVTALYALESPIIGVIIIAIAVFMAFLRVFTGVHFPRDVIVGFLCGILMGAIGFWII